MSFPLAAYLARLGLSRAPDLATLLRAQMRAIPFENLDPLRGITPDLAPEALEAKLVDGRRGGYCFEQNLLLSGALTALGMPHRRVLARVLRNGDRSGPRSHLALLVETGAGVVLADAGFGGPGADTTLPLDGGAPVAATGGTWRLRREGDIRTLERQGAAGWTGLYAFDMAEVLHSDIMVANHYCATHPAAPFPAHAMLARHAADARRSLWDRRFTKGDATRDLTDAEDFHRTLAREFTLSLPESETARLWQRILAAPERDPA